MQAIITKFLPPTNARGARIKASCVARTLTAPYNHALSGQAAHREVAEELARRLEWDEPHYGKLLGGQLPSGDYVFVFDNHWSKE